MPDKKLDPHRHVLPEPLLVSRKNAASMLGGVSVATIIRMELRGALIPVRLNPHSLTSQVFYRMRDLKALVEKAMQGDQQ